MAMTAVNHLWAEWCGGSEERDVIVDQVCDISA